MQQKSKITELSLLYIKECHYSSFNIKLVTPLSLIKFLTNIYVAFG